MKQTFVFLIAMIGFCQTSFASRLVRIEVSLGDVVILEGSTGDNGRPNADEVWKYLAKVHLRPTKDFEHLVPKNAIIANKLFLNAKGKLVVQYGGQMEFKSVTFIKVEHRGKPYWQLEPVYISRWTNSRLIRRSDAGGLKGFGK